MLTWDSAALKRDGRHEIKLTAAVDGTGFDPDSPYAHDDYEVRVRTTAHAEAKSKRGKKSRSATSAVEYSLPVSFTEPVNYQADQWTYRAPRWTDAFGNEHVAESTESGGAIRDGYIFEAVQGRETPGDITSRLPFDPETLNTDAYNGAYVLSDDLLAVVTDDVGEARLTPRGNGQFWLTFGDNVYSTRRDGDRIVSEVFDDLALGLIDAIADLGFGRTAAEAALNFDADTQTFQTGSTGVLSILANPKAILVDHAFSSLWQPLATSYTPGYWEKTADEWIPTAEEAMAAYLADLEADGVAFDPILGPAASSSPLVLSSPAAAVPEPGTLAAMASLGLVALGRRRGARR
ncbi:MAG: PEP-CTERM sorting domain-containing protein [Planctomycetota bacterium]